LDCVELGTNCINMAQAKDKCKSPKSNMKQKLKQTPSSQPPFALDKRKSFKSSIPQRFKAGPKTNILFKTGPKTNILLKLKEKPGSLTLLAANPNKRRKCVKPNVRGSRVDRCSYIRIYVRTHTHTHTHYVYDTSHRRVIHLRSARRMLCAAGHLCCCWNAVCCWLCAAGCFVGPLLMLAKPAFK